MHRPINCLSLEFAVFVTLICIIGKDSSNLVERSSISYSETQEQWYRQGGDLQDIAGVDECLLGILRQGSCAAT